MAVDLPIFVRISIRILRFFASFLTRSVICHFRYEPNFSTLREAGIDFQVSPLNR